MQSSKSWNYVHLVFVGLVVGSIPAEAWAYVGPGAGLTLLGSLWALIVAIVLVLGGLLILPIRKLRKSMKEKKAAKEQDAVVEDKKTAATSSLD